jgi:hypothetical protein
MDIYKVKQLLPFGMGFLVLGPGMKGRRSPATREIVIIRGYRCPLAMPERLVMT